ncbi:MAG: NusG domain II-containing protein [Lachnospiraceae bacterium]
MIKTRTWIIIILVLLAASGGITAFLYAKKAPGSIANVYVDGECVYSVDLSLVTQGYTREIISKDGSVNTLSIEPGRICISAADCPDQVCVHTGWIADSVAPIVCLPHRLVVRIEGNSAKEESEFDSVVR